MIRFFLTPPMFFCFVLFFFFNDTATTEIYTLSLHDALPIERLAHPRPAGRLFELGQDRGVAQQGHRSKKRRISGAHALSGRVALPTTFAPSSQRLRASASGSHGWTASRATSTAV